MESRINHSKSPSWKIPKSFCQTPLRPAVEAPPGRVPLAEAFGQVAPRCPRLGDPQDGIDEESIVLGRGAALTGPAGQEVLDPIPVLVSESMAVGHG